MTNFLQLVKLNLIPLIIIITTIIFFICSSIRHALFNSTAFELGIYDQVAYLISQNLTPFSTFLNVHHLGNHAAFAMYPVGWLYKIYPAVHWLLIIQAFSLALGALPSWGLARQAGLNKSQSLSIAILYLLYPLIFNINLFDFHPEVMAIPALLGAILAARLDKIIWFTIAILWVLACKDALSLTIAAMGIWLFFWEKKKLSGGIALVLGTAWFIIVTQSLIPYFKGGKGPGGVGRYRYLGNSVTEIVINLFFKPNLVLGRIFSGETLGYLLLVFTPVIFWLSPWELAPLIAAIPVFITNILSDITAQRDLIHQYSLPVVPFLVVAVIASVKSGSYMVINWLDGRWQKITGKPPLALNKSLPKLIIIWSLISFIILAKYGYFGTIYLSSLDTWQATKEAVNLVKKNTGAVLTTANIAPHLSHRTVIKLTNANRPNDDLTQFDYIVLNLRHPGWNSTPEFAKKLQQQLGNNPQFELSYSRDDVYLFHKKKSG
jgi:uncharacterized membrane protein